MSPLFLLITFLLFGFLFLKQWRKSSKSQNKKFPPGAPKIPLIGHLHHVIGTRKSKSESLRDMARKYGPVMHLQLGELTTVVISTAEAAKELLKAQELNFAQRPVVHAVAVMPHHESSIIFSPYNDHWRHMRKIFVAELLSVRRIQAFKSVREEEVQSLIESISSSRGLHVIDISKKIFQCTNNIISQAICGGCKDQENFLSSIEELLSLGGGLGFHDVFPSLWILGFLNWKTRALRKLYQRLDKMFDAIICEHKAKRETFSESNNGGSEERDLVDVLLKVQEREDLETPLTNIDIKVTILEFFGATSVIIATVTESAMAEMVRNPRVMEKAQAEVRKVLNGKGEIDQNDLEKLSYLKSVIKETLIRLHPPGPLFVRESRERIEIAGFEIPKKTTVVINAWAIGRDPKSWADAESFRPERFDGNSANFKGTCLEFIPFGAGRRMCPGISFGLSIVDLPLAQLLYHFNWRVPDGVKPEELDMAKVHGLSPKRKHGLCLVATPN